MNEFKPLSDPASDPAAGSSDQAEGSYDYVCGQRDTLEAVLMLIMERLDNNELAGQAEVIRAAAQTGKCSGGRAGDHAAPDGAREASN